MAIATTISAAQLVVANPPTYHRNDEELVGEKINESAFPNPLPFEDYFIGLDSGIQQIVSNFTSDLNNIIDPVTAEAQFYNLIDQYAPQILITSRNSVSTSNFQNPDDRPLYWSRLKMQVLLKGHPFLLKAPGLTELLINKFEQHSRGFNSVDFSSNNPAFTSAYQQNPNLKKILVSGFDPFLLQTNPELDYHNTFQSNPSGCVSLGLHNKVVTDNSNFPIAIIQSAMFPVRYEDFDNGIVEDFFRQYIFDPSKRVKMIMTMSQGSPFLFEVDRFATRTRTGGFEDNLLEYRDTNSFSINTAEAQSNNWLESTLPLEIVPDLNDINDPNPFPVNPYPDYKFYILHNQFFQTQVEFNLNTDYKYKSFDKGYDGYFLNKNLSNTERKLRIATPSLLTQDLDENTLPSNVPQSSPSKVKIIKGSGGNYLSNEIFYRVSLLRDTWIKSQLPQVVSFPSGHFHLPLMQFRKGEDIYADITQKVILTVFERIKRAAVVI